MQHKNISKTLEAYNRLKERIRSSRLMPGQKLIYRDLEELLDMSRTPVVNALMMLEKDGLVVSKRNRGFYVRDMSVKEAEDIYDVREVLETTAVSFAIKQYEPEDLEVLRQCVNAYNDYTGDDYDKNRYELDTAIHVQIARMSKNECFVTLLKQFYDSIYFNMNVAALRPHLDTFKTDHNELLQAIEARNVDTATSIIVRHIRMAKKAFVAFISNL